MRRAFRGSPLRNGNAPRQVSEAPGRWADYARRWTGWNQLRPVAALAARAAFIVALRR